MDTYRLENGLPVKGFKLPLSTSFAISAVVSCLLKAARGDSSFIPLDASSFSYIWARYGFDRGSNSAVVFSLLARDAFSLSLRAAIVTNGRGCAVS